MFEIQWTSKLKRDGTFLAYLFTLNNLINQIREKFQYLRKIQLFGRPSNNLLSQPNFEGDQEKNLNEKGLIWKLLIKGKS